MYMRAYKGKWALFVVLVLNGVNKGKGAEQVGIYINGMSLKEAECEFCDLKISGYTFYLHAWGVAKDDAYYNLFSDDKDHFYCEECAAIVTGEDTAKRVQIKTEYEERKKYFVSIPWIPTSNPLLVIKTWGSLKVSIMKDKYGRSNRFGVTIGRSERWNTHEKQPYERYMHYDDTLITSVQMAETIAFWWANFIFMNDVKPEDPYTVQDFKDFAAECSLGVLPKLKRKVESKWWEV